MELPDCFREETEQEILTYLQEIFRFPHFERFQPDEKERLMATPTEKSEAMERFIDSHTPNPLGRRGSIEANKCSWCKGDAIEFRDQLSIKEYTISGLCQSCQDKTFGE